jgi:hypothetical protein
LSGDAASWPWTTYRATAGVEPCPTWVFVDWLDWAFMTASRSEAQSRYQQYVNTDADGMSDPDSKTFMLGTKRFQRSVLSLLEQSAPDRLLPQWCRMGSRPRLESLFVPTDARGRQRSRAVDDRDQAIHVAYESHGYRQAEIAMFLQMHPSTVSKAVRRERTRSESRLGEPRHMEFVPGSAARRSG